MAGPNQQRLQDLIAPPAAKMVEGPNRKRLRKMLADQGLDLDQELANQQQAAAQRRAQRASARAATGSSQQPAGSSDWLVDLNPDIELIRQGKDPKAEWADELREDQEQLARTLEEIQNSNIPDYEKRRLIAEGTKRQDKSWLFDALDWLDKLDAGARSVFGTIQYALDSDADRSWEALSGVYAKGIADNISWSEILDEYEMPFLNYWLRDETDALNPNSNKQMQEDPGGWSALGRAFLTFSLDTATSPTTYLTGGAKPLTNLAADGGMALYRLADQTAVAATKAGDVVDAGRIAEVATRTAEVGYRGLKQSERKVLEEGLRKYNTMPEGVKNLQGGAYLGRKVLVPGSRQIASVTTQPLARAMAGARQSSAFKSMASPFNTVTTMLKAEMRSGDQAKVSQAMETLASVQLAKADAMRWFVNTQSELDGIIRGIKKNKIDREELSLFIEDPAAALNMASPSALRLAGRYLEEPAVKKVVDQAIDWQGRALKDDFNRIVGEEVIETMDNYVPTLMSEDFLAKAVKGPKRRVAEFTTATFQRGAKFKVGEEYMGEMIVPTEMHPRNLTPKQQGEDILRRNFGEEFVGPLYNRDWVKAAKSRTFVAHVRLRGEMTAKYMRERGVGFTADDIAKMSQSPITDVGDSLRTWGFRKRTETAMAARQAAADSGAFVETSGTRVLKDIRAIEEITSQGGTLKVLDDQLAATGGFVADRIEQVRKLVGRRAQLAERHRRIESKLTTDVGRMLQRVRQGGTATDKEMDAAAKLTAWAAGIEPDDIARINQTWDDIDNELAQYMADLDLDADDVGTVNDLVNGMLSNASNRLDTIDDLLAIPQANLSNQEILRRVQLAKERDYLLESMEGLVKMRANMDEVETLVRDVDRVRSGFTQERAFEVALWRIKQNPTLTAAQKRAASRNLFRNAPRTARRDLNSRAVDRLVEINAKGRLTRRNGELAEFVATPKGMKIAKAQSGIEDLTIDALSGAAGRDSAVELIGRTVYYSDDAAAAGLDADELRRIQVNVAMKNPRVVAGVEDADRIVDAEMLLSAVAAKLVDFGPKKELTATQRVFVNGLNAVFKRHSAAVAADEGPEAVSRFIDDLDATLGRLAAGDNPNPIAADFVNQAGGRIADQGLTPEAALQVRKDLEKLESTINKDVDALLNAANRNIEELKAALSEPTPAKPSVAEDAATAAGKPASKAQAEPDVTDELTAAFEANRQARAEFEAIEAEMKPISDAEKAAWERYKAARQAADRAASPNATADPELEFSLSKRMLEGIRNIVGEKPPAATRKELDELDLLIKYVPDAQGNLPQITPEDLEMIRSNYRTLKPRMTVPDRPILDRSMTDERVPGVWWTDSYRLLSQEAVNPATGFKLPPYLGGPVDLTDLLSPAQLKELDGIADASRLPRKFASSDEFYAAVAKLKESSQPFAWSKVGSNLDVIASKYAPDAGKSPNFVSLLEGAPTPTDGVVMAPRSVSFQNDMHIVLESADPFDRPEVSPGTFSAFPFRAEVNAGYFSDLADGITIVARREDGDNKPLALYIGDKLVGLLMPIRTGGATPTREIVGNRVRELLKKLTSRSKTTTDGQRRALYDLDSEIAATRRSGSTATQDLDEARRALDELGMVPNNLYDMPRSQRLQGLGERYQELQQKWYSSEDALRRQRLNRVRQEFEGDELGGVYAEETVRMVDEDIASGQQRVADIEAFLARAPKESAKWVKANYPRAAGMVPSSTPKDKLIAAAKKSLAEIRKGLDEAATPQGRDVAISLVRDRNDPLKWVEGLIENADTDPAVRTLAEDLLRRVDQPRAAAAATPPPAPLANEVAATPAVDPQEVAQIQMLETRVSIDSERIRLIEETMLSRGAALDAEDPKKLAIELERLERQAYGSPPPDGRSLEPMIASHGSATKALQWKVARIRDDIKWNSFEIGILKGDRSVMREELDLTERFVGILNRTVAGEGVPDDELLALGFSFEFRARKLREGLVKADELRRSITSAAAPPRLSAFLLIDELVSPAMTSMSPKRAEELLARNPASGALLRRLGYTPEQVAENYRTAMKKLGYDGILTDDLVKRSATVFDEKQIRHANKVAQVEAELDALQRELRSSIRDGQRSLLSMSHDAFGFRIDRQTDKVEDAVAVAADNASKLAAMERTEQNVAEYLMRSEAQKVFKAAEGQSDEAAAALRLHGQAMVAEADMLANGRGNVSEMMSGNLAATPGLAERMASMNGLMFKQLDRQTFADPNIVEILTHAQKLTIPGEMKGFLRAFDYVTNVFKGYAILSPGFHIRNLFGAAMNNWLADMNVMSYPRFWRAESVYFAALREHGKPDKALLAVRAKLGDDIGGAYEQWHAMEASTGMGLAGAWGEDVGRTTTILGNQQTSGRLANAGRAISGDQYGLREQAFSLKNNALVRGNGYVAQRIERFMRGSLAFDSLYRGGDVINASLRVRKYHFDYNDLSAFEENVLRRVIPFYVWVSRNLPLQVEGLIRKPKVALSFYRLKRNIEAQSEAEAYTPGWYAREFSIRLPRNLNIPFFSNDGNAKYLFLDMPFMDLGLLQDPVGGSLSAVNPWIKAPVEMFVRDGKFFTGAPFSDKPVPLPDNFAGAALGQALLATGRAQRATDGTIMTNEKILYAIEQGMPMFGLLNRALDPDKAANVFVSKFLGIGIRSNDERSQSNEIQRRLSFLNDKIGVFGKDGLGYDISPTGKIEITNNTRKVELNAERLQFERNFLLDAANTMDAQTLADTIPEVGESTARWIVAHRVANGRFNSLSDLGKVQDLRRPQIDTILLALAEKPEKMGIPSQNMVDLNTSSIDELAEALPGVGPSTAKKIIDYRRTYGEIRTVDDLRNIKGLSDSAVDEIRDYLLEELVKRSTAEYRRYLQQAGYRPLQELVLTP
jgi:competence ComEA-like helix-hairpin-helix protein